MKNRDFPFIVAVRLSTLALHLLTGCAQNPPSVMNNMTNDEFRQAYDGPYDSYLRRARR